MAHGHVFVLRRLSCVACRERWVGRKGRRAWRDDGPGVDYLGAVRVDDFNGLVGVERNGDAASGGDGVRFARVVFRCWKGGHCRGLDLREAGGFQGVEGRDACLYSC